MSIARVLLSAWVGAAILFVIIGIAQFRIEQIDSVTRSRIAAVRFPPYYTFGFVSVVGGLLLTLCTWVFQEAMRRRLMVVCGLLLIVLGLMLIDYFFIYSPLAGMLDPPDQPRPSSFVTLHAASRVINGVHVALSLCAALILSWPEPGRISRDRSADPVEHSAT